MQQTHLFAFVISAALVAGAFVGMRWQPPVHLLAALLAFACGAARALVRPGGFPDR